MTGQTVKIDDYRMIDKYDFDAFLIFAFLYAIWTIGELRDIKKELREIRRKLD